jgi:hypothetical protein
LRMASMPAGKRPSVYESFLAAPRHRVAEIIGGELRTHPRPATPHARAASKLGAKLDRSFDEGDWRAGGGGSSSTSRKCT